MASSLSGMPPSAPPPTFAEIPLPPGMNLEQFESLQRSLVTIGIDVAVAFGVLLWDYLYMNSSKELWHTPAAWSFVILRYAGILATLPSLFFTSGQSDHCQVAVVVSQVGAVLVVAASGVIFCYRVVAIWGGHKVVCVVVGVLYIVMIGCWSAVATRYYAATGPHTHIGSNCQMVPIVSWAPICYASSVAFDTTIILLTIFKLRANINASKISYLIYRDSLMYFFMTSATNIVVLVIQALGPNFMFIKPLPMPFSTLMTTTMGQRVFLNLKLFHQRQDRERQGIPFSSRTSDRDTPKPDRGLIHEPVRVSPSFVMCQGPATQAHYIEPHGNFSDTTFTTCAPHKHYESVEMADFIQEPISPLL